MDAYDTDGNKGSDISDTTFTIELLKGNVAPVILLTYYPRELFVHQTITFNASASYDPDGEIVKYLWDFGDGSTGQGVIVNHSYSNPGVYIVKLRVCDDSGIWNETSISLTVWAAKVGIGNITLAEGEWGLIPIWIYAQNLGAYHLNITFNPKVLSITEVLGGSSPFDSPIWSVNKNGYVLINQFLTSKEGFSGNITVAYLNVTAIGKPGEYSVLDLEIISLINAMMGEELTPRKGTSGSLNIVPLEISVNPVIDIDEEGYVVLRIFFDSPSLDPVKKCLPNGLGAYILNITAGSFVDIVRALPGQDFNATPVVNKIEEEVIVTAFVQYLEGPLPKGINVVRLWLRLDSPAGVECVLKPDNLSIVDAKSGKEYNALVIGKSLKFIRGDANNDGKITIADAMFIAQYLVGLRDPYFNLKG